MKKKIVIALVAIPFICVYFYLFLGKKGPCSGKGVCGIEATETGRAQIMNKEKNNMKSQKVREPAVAGTFYDGSRSVLLQRIEEFLEKAEIEPIEGSILALVSPHAGYSYSGQIAAYGFKQLVGRDYDTVIIMGPNHRVRGFSGTSVYKEGSFRTPLGVVPVDREFAEEMMSCEPKLVFSELAHEQEHSIEVQIPFLQVILPDAKIVPVVMGDYSTQACEELSEAIVKTMEKLKSRKVLLISSTDLAHGHPYDTTVSMDRLAINDIVAMDEKKIIDHSRSGTCEMCGYGPVLATLMVAKKLGYDKTEFLKYINSMDVGGTADWIVGYTSIVIYKGIKEENHDNPETVKKTEQYYSDEERKELLEIARKSMEDYVKHGKKTSFSPQNEKYLEKRGGFVTLNKDGQLRGCIGYIVAVKPLYETVAEMAINAAARDTRFSPVTADELDDIDIEISVLSPLKTVEDINEIEVGKHGIIIRKGFNSGLLLPQVATEYGWDRDTFLQHTCLKAGLPPDSWKKGAELQIFSAEVFREKNED